VIDGIQPPRHTLPAYLRGYGKSKLLRKARTDTLVAELYRRGVTMQEIFGVFYALEQMEDARLDEIFGNDEEGQHGRVPLTVEDAELVGFVSQPIPPTGRVF